MNNSMHSQLTPTNLAAPDYLDADYLDFNPDADLDQLATEVLTEKLTALEKAQVHAIMNGTVSPRPVLRTVDETTMISDSTSIPREVPAPIGSTDSDNAREAAMHAAQPRYFEADVVDTSRLESNEYNRSLVEHDVQAKVANLDGQPYDGFGDLVDTAKQDKQAFQVPSSEIVRQYRDEHLGGAITGVSERFADLAPNTTIADLEAVTSEAERQTHWLERWTVNIVTVRSESIGAERGSVTAPKEYV